MIDIVYHHVPLKLRRKSISFAAGRQANRRWSSEHNEALRKLLDHLAEELALEYVRLMRSAKPANGEPK
jgi:hypothetical protein